MAALPPLRNIEAVQAEHDGQPVIVLHDSEGYAEDQIVLSGPAFFVAAHLDGRNNIVDIQERFARQFRGGIITEDQVMEVVSFLDSQGFLLSDSFEKRRLQMDRAFSASPTRHAALAGRSYPDDPDELKAFLDAFLDTPEAPLVFGEPDAPVLPGLIVPHIDFHRGGLCYGAGYRALAAQGIPSTVIVLGVAHNAVPAPFVLCAKTIETPLGDLPCDTDMVERLATACQGNPFAFEAVHRTEHSVEFQAVMIARLYGERVRVVPILCSQIAGEGGCDAAPENMPATRAFLDVLRREMENPGARVTVIAGADLAHVGKRFGDPYDIDDTVIASVRARDEADLAFVTAPDGNAFYQSVMADKNARRVCGLGSIYTTLQALRGKIVRGDVLGYEYAHDEAGGIVSFTACALS